jgi:putative restriction endonuclease
LINREYDSRVRLAAFAWLDEKTRFTEGVIDWADLRRGFEFEGERIHLVAQQGIFKPRSLQIPLTIRTSNEGPYDDALDDRSGLLRYSYRGTDPDHRDNRGLRTAMLEGIPLVYFHAVVPGKYLVAKPVYIVGDSPGELMFSVAVDDDRAVQPGTVTDSPDARREYVTRIYHQRLHQKGFRERVLRAYRRHCAICRLKHAELLDAAHIIPDKMPDGDPVVENGLSLCKIHHAAFDTNVLGVSPDYEVVVREDILEEIDGPMLQHGLKEMHGVRLLVPRSVAEKPDRDRLARRFEEFLRVV